MSAHVCLGRVSVSMSISVAVAVAVSVSVSMSVSVSVSVSVFGAGAMHGVQIRRLLCTTLNHVHGRRGARARRLTFRRELVCCISTSDLS